METFSALLAICAGIHRSPVNSPHKGWWRGVLMFSLICARINGWVSNREAGGLKRHWAHYDVIVMLGFDPWHLCSTKCPWMWRCCWYICSCDQAALWMVQSVCPSVCLSVCLSVTPFWLCSHHLIITKFSGVITNDRSDVHAKGQGQGQMSMSQRS